MNDTATLPPHTIFTEPSAKSEILQSAHGIVTMAEWCDYEMLRLNANDRIFNFFIKEAVDGSVCIARCANQWNTTGLYKERPDSTWEYRGY